MPFPSGASGCSCSGGCPAQAVQPLQLQPVLIKMIVFPCLGACRVGRSIASEISDAGRGGGSGRGGPLRNHVMFVGETLCGGCSWNFAFFAFLSLSQSYGSEREKEGEGTLLLNAVRNHPPARLPYSFA